MKKYNHVLRHGCWCLSILESTDLMEFSHVAKFAQNGLKKEEKNQNASVLWVKTSW